MNEKETSYTASFSEFGSPHDIKIENLSEMKINPTTLSEVFKKLREKRMDIMTSNFFEIEKSPKKMSLHLGRLNDKNTSIIVVTMIYSATVDEHISYLSEPFEFASTNAEQYIFKTFSNLYCRVFEKCPCSSFDRETINYILRLSKNISDFEFRFNFELDY